jgi:uncharacterized protein (DUF736 family)
MAYEQKDNSGSLFKNDRKERDTHPDYRGSAMIGGEEMWVSAWIKEGRDGKKYMSLSFQPKMDVQSTKTVARPAAKTVEDDDIPW